MNLRFFRNLAIDIRIKNKNSIKNRLLTYLADNPKKSDAYSTSLKLKIDFNTAYVLYEELRDEGMLDLIEITHKHATFDYVALVTPKGKVFINHGGYSSSAIIDIISYFKKNAISLILSLIVALVVAFLTYYFGWN